MKEGIMMLTRFDVSTRQIFIGNLLLVICCVFYIAWWLLAFKPVHPIKGTKSGWLLLPAFIFGIISVVMIARMGGNDKQLLLPHNGILIGGIVAYVILAAITSKLMNRPITTELILIVGWLVLMFRELNVLYSLAHYSKIGVIVLLVICVVLTIISLVCYVRYYHLDAFKGYIDGMIPLIIVAVMMVVIDLSLFIGG